MINVGLQGSLGGCKRLECNDAEGNAMRPLMLLPYDCFWQALFAFLSSRV